MKISIKRYIGNVFFDILPSSSYWLKRHIARWMGVQVSSEVKLNIGCKFYGEGPIIIEDDTWVGPNVFFYTASDSGIFIGKNCDIAPDVRFVCGSHNIGNRERRAGAGTAGDIQVLDGCWVGFGSKIFPSLIGNASIIAAGSVVLENIDSNTLAGGVPAKRIREL